MEKGNYRMCSRGKRTCLSLCNKRTIVSIKRSRPCLIGYVDRRLRRLVFCSGSIVGGLRRELTCRLNRLSKCPSCQTFFIGSKTRTGRGTLGLTSFRAKGGQMITFEGSFRKHASTTIRIASGPTLRTPVGAGRGICFTSLSVGRIRARLAGKSIYTMVLRKVSKMKKVRIPSRSFLQRLERLAEHCKIMLILSRVRSNCNHAKGFFTRR